MRQIIRAAFVELQNLSLWRQRPGILHQMMRAMFGAVLGAICFTTPLPVSVSRTPSLVAAFAVAGIVISLFIGFAYDLASADKPASPK